MELTQEELRRLAEDARWLKAEMEAVAMAASPEEYGGRYVAVRDGLVVGCDTRFESLLERLPDRETRRNSGIAVGYVYPPNARVLL